MARYKTTVPYNGTIEVNGLAQLRNLRDLQSQLWLTANGANNDGEVIRLLNILPSFAALFSGTKGLADVAETLGDYAAELADKQKSELLTAINNGYKFLDKQVTQWDSTYYKVKFNVPLADIIDTDDNKRIKYIHGGTGYVISKTTSDGKITITM